MAVLFGKEGWESGSSLWKGRVGEWKFSLERKGGRVAVLFGKEGWESGNSPSQTGYLFSNTVYSLFCNVTVAFCFAGSRNVILIGGPSENQFTSPFLDKIPVEVKGKIANGLILFQGKTQFIKIQTHKRLKRTLILIDNRKHVQN